MSFSSKCSRVARSAWDRTARTRGIWLRRRISYLASSKTDSSANSAIAERYSQTKRADGVAAARLALARDPPGQHQARRQPLNVPFPWPGHRFVKVVEIEDEMPIGGGEGAEVSHMGVAAHLHGEARGGPFRQVLRHERGGPPQETERRSGHASHLDRDQLAQPMFVDLLEHLQGIGTIVSRLPFALVDAPENRPQAAAPLPALGRAQELETVASFCSSENRPVVMLSA